MANKEFKEAMKKRPQYDYKAENIRNVSEMLPQERVEEHLKEPGTNYLLFVINVEEEGSNEKSRFKNPSLEKIAEYVTKNDKQCEYFRELAKNILDYRGGLEQTTFEIELDYVDILSEKLKLVEGEKAPFYNKKSAFKDSLKEVTKDLHNQYNKVGRVENGYLALMVEKDSLR